MRPFCTDPAVIELHREAVAAAFRQAHEAHMKLLSLSGTPRSPDAYAASAVMEFANNTAQLHLTALAQLLPVPPQRWWFPTLQSVNEALLSAGLKPIETAP